MSYNYQTQYDSPNFTPARLAPATFGMERKIEGITIHHWGDPATNPTFEGVVNYLCRPNGNTSAHYVATGTGRKVACIVAPGDVAWHSGNAWGNARTIGIELDPRARDEDYDVAAELVADIRSAFGDVPIYWHSYFTATACPGRWNPYRLDELSYTKYSHKTDWGKGGNKNQPLPAPAPEPSKPLYKVLKDSKQVGAYAEEANAWRGFKQHNATKITFDGKDVTATLKKKYEQESPTTTPPEDGGGMPVAEKPDYSEENNVLLKQILSIVQELLNKVKEIFK